MNWPCPWPWHLPRPLEVGVTIIWTRARLGAVAARALEAGERGQLPPKDIFGEALMQ